MSFKIHRESHTIENIAKTIGEDLERITDEIQRNSNAIKLHEEHSEAEEDELYNLKGDLHRMSIRVNGMEKQLALLLKQSQNNTKIIGELLKQRASPIPEQRKRASPIPEQRKVPPMILTAPDIKRTASRYQPQHPYFQQAAAQSAARKAYCWLTQSSNDEKNKLKQDKLVKEYYADKTTDARREAIVKELMAMARCKDKCKLQGKTLISSKGCGDDDAVRKFIMGKLQSSKYIEGKTGKKSVLTRRRAKTALKSPGGYDAKSFRV